MSGLAKILIRARSKLVRRLFEIGVLKENKRQRLNLSPTLVFTISSLECNIYYLWPYMLNGKAACDKWWASLLLNMAARRID